MIDYNKILRQALELLKVNKSLWVLGLFLSVLFLCLIFPIIYELNALFSTTLWFLAAILMVRVWIALILSIKTVIDKKPLVLGQSFRASKTFFLRIFGVFILLNIATALFIAIANNPNTFFITFVIYIVFFVGLGLLSILTSLFVTLYDLKIGDATKKSYALILKHWASLLVVILSLGVVAMAPIFFLMFMVQLRGSFGIFTVSGLIFLILQSLYLVLAQSVWVLVFLDLVKPQKTEETEPLPMPEIV
jgi:hypothetical protein